MWKCSTGYKYFCMDYLYVGKSMRTKEKANHSVSSIILPLVAFSKWEALPVLKSICCLERCNEAKRQLAHRERESVRDVSGGFVIGEIHKKNRSSCKVSSHTSTLHSDRKKVLWKTFFLSLNLRQTLMLYRNPTTFSGRDRRLLILVDWNATGDFKQFGFSDTDLALKQSP